MASLKEYRNNELKWFLLANILLMIISSDALVFGETVNALISSISTVINITAFSSAIYIFTFISDSVVPSRIKVFLVFLWNKQPSCTIFTDMERKCEDNRFTIEEAKKKYENIYKKIEKCPKSFDQTPLWYEIYNQNRDNPIVFGSNRDYLLLRDMHTQTIILILVYATLLFMTKVIIFSWKFMLYLIFMVILLNISARVQGKRMVYNVLSVDLNKPDNINEIIK